MEDVTSAGKEMAEGSINVFMPARCWGLYDFDSRRLRGWLVSHPLNGVEHDFG